MGQYRIFSEPLGVDFMVEGPEAPNAESTFQILKQVVPPDRMIKAFEDGNRELARAAYKNGYFDQESDTGLYDAFKQAAGEVMEGLGDISKEVSLDFTASGAMTYGVPGSQKLVEGARAEQQKRRRKRKATGYQTMAEVFAGYKTIGDAGKLAFSKIVGEGDEDIDASIQFIGDMMKTQSFIDDGAAIMAEQFGDFDMYRDLKAGRVEPDKKQALAASLFVQLENPVAAVTTGSIRSTTNMLRRGTAKKLAEQFKEANSKKFLLEKQLNRLPANASDKLVKTATDALEKATKESDEILAKITPFTEQKAKAGFTNQMVGKGMQAVGKAGEHFGNLTEFIRRAGVEEATTLLMRAGLSEQVAKGVIYTSIGGAADLTDGEASLTGTGFGALAAYMGPRAIASMGRSTAILGKQLTMAETTMPFFKRVGALPADDPKLAEVLVDRTDNLVLGDAASQLKPILTQTRDLPSTVRGVARFIDRSGLGRLGTETANVAKAAAGGAALPGAFGYMAGGEEGAASAIGASAPFIAAGLGYGSLLRFNNKSDLLAKQLGDLEYHKQSLTETERANFEKLDKDQQVAISTFSQFFPDVEIRMKSMGKDGPNGAHYVDGSDSVIEINTDTNLSYGTILSHEIGHHIERHGLLPNILEEMLGNPEKGKVGIFTEIDKSTGKPKITTDENGMKHYELTDEFRELQKAYVDKLANSNVSEKAKQAYETPEQFARELFAETVAERMLSGKTSKRAGQSSTYKLIESLGDRITSGGFMRKAMHSLGMATKADGSLVQGTGILGKPFKTSKQLDNLVKRYEDETIGLSESEIREQRPVTKDDELDTVIVSPSDPIESLQVFNNGGHFKTDKDGNIIVNPITKKPEVYSPSETRRANQALARDLTESIKARENDLPEGHVTLSETEDGKLTGSGKFIDDSIIDELSRTGRYNPSQINFLREASKAGRDGIGNQMLLFYYAATGKGGRKYKTLKGGYRDSLVYGITITKDGNVILDTVSLDKLQKNIDYLLKRRGNEIGQAFGGSDPAVIRKNFESMFEKYLDNHAKGIVNGTPESGITEGQKNFLNAAFGPVSKSQIADNPTLSNLGERRANTLGTYRSRRLDRIGTLNPTGNTRNIVIDRIRRNLMPGRSEADKLFIPAYHGTPHTFAPEPGAPFGKFRTSAIGTGEGAQAYGHGLYFAGKKEVAEHYRDMLTRQHGVKYPDGVYEKYSPLLDKAQDDVIKAQEAYDEAASNFITDENTGELTIRTEFPPEAVIKKLESEVDKAQKQLDKLNEELLSKSLNKGSLYKVELAPKENEYLLYDKTLGEQTKDIQDKLRKVLTELEGEDLWEYRKDLDYRDITDNALENVPEPEISRRLKEAGIPGIKYLDGSSRNQATFKITPPSQTVSGKYMVKGDDYNSKGKHFDTKAEAEKYLQEQLDKLDYNYVIFDEADVQITDKLFMPAGDAYKKVPIDLQDEYINFRKNLRSDLEVSRFTNDGQILSAPFWLKSAINQIDATELMGVTRKLGRERIVNNDLTVDQLASIALKSPNIKSKSFAEYLARRVARGLDIASIEMAKVISRQDAKMGTLLNRWIDYTTWEINHPITNDPIDFYGTDLYEVIHQSLKEEGQYKKQESFGEIKQRQNSDSNKLFMPASEAGAGKGKQAEAADLDFKISTRNPTAKNATENPITEDLIINTASIADDATMLESHALALQEYPGIKKNSKVPKRIIDSFVDHVVDNLLYLHDQVRPEVRDRSKLWYDGARNITEKWNQQYGNDKQSIAAALASLSPQKDWFMNVDLARRMLDIYKDQSGFAFDKAMAKKYIQLFEKGIGKKKATEIAEAMVGKTLNDLKSDYEQAAFIRSYDEVYNPREYQVVSPEGDFIGLAKSLDGVNKKVAWGSMTEISKAVKVLRNPSKESISTALGNAHKIRNFYNNILLPNADEFSVTIDTHAIAAALLRPLAGADLEVANNFGSKPKGAKRSIKNSSVKGISGTYGIYADAYRKAAEARGILPREMQSITWEAVRGLYEAKWKTKSNKAKIDNLWKKYENGELTLNETREQILESAGGITEPEWVTERSNSGADGTNESANKSQELYRPELGGSELRANPRRGRTNPRGSQEVNFLPAGNFSRQPANRITRQAPAMPGNRFMLPAATAGAKSAERFR